jgi:hypothetical protein
MRGLGHFFALWHSTLAGGTGQLNCISDAIILCDVSPDCKNSTAVHPDIKITTEAETVPM